jgi:hypothetical protein
MKLRDGGSTVLIVLAALATLGYFSSQFLGHDNLLEESAEYAIELHTGVDIDLSPESPDGEHHEHSDKEHKKNHK